MEKSGWKALAIVLLIVLIALIGLFAFFYSIGTKEIQLENECSINICENATSYYYYDHYCECYDYDYLGNAFVVDSKYLK